MSATEIAARGADCRRTDRASLADDADFDRTGWLRDNAERYPQGVDAKCRRHLGDRHDVTLFRVLGDLETPERLEWNFDRIATDVVVKSVRAQNPAVSIVPIEYDANALAAAIHQIKPFESYSDPARIEPALRQLTDGKSIDTIILIARSDSSKGALLYFQGVGLQTERTFLPRAPTTPYAALALFVIDGSTMRVLTKNTVLEKGRIYNVKPLIEFEPPGGPAPFLPGFNFPMTAEQKDFTRPLLEGLVLAATQELMRSSGF